VDSGEISTRFAPALIDEAMANAFVATPVRGVHACETKQGIETKHGVKPSLVR
jgi:hypothetical protein